MFNSRSSISISTFLSSLIGSIMRGRRSVRCGQTCEYRKARLILTHDPGEELFLGAFIRLRLFSGNISISPNHRRTCYLSQSARGGRSEGTHGTSDPARRNRRGRETRRPDEAGEPAPLRGRFLTFDTQNLSPETAEQQKEYRQSILAKTSPRSGADYSATTDHPTVGNADQHGLKAEYSENPVMNLFYTRDQLITTAKGIVIGRMNSPQREKGCDILQFCLEKIGMKPLHRIEGRELISKAGISIRSAIRLSSAAGCAPRNRPSISLWSTTCWAATVWS